MVGFVTEQQRRSDYQPALRSAKAARRLHLIATWWIVFVIITAVVGTAAGVVAIFREHTSGERLVTGASLFGVAFWTIGGLLVGFAAQAYSRDVEARAPWLR